MLTPLRRYLILFFIGLSIGAMPGCSASETDNTVAPAGGSSNPNTATGGRAGTTGGVTSGGRGGASGVGGLTRPSTR